MGLTKKIKLALDETRILILGAQILLGFQFRAVFSDGYEELPAPLRYLDGFAILPMICVVALLISPGPYHRIVEDGEDSQSFHRLVTTIATWHLYHLRLLLGWMWLWRSVTSSVKCQVWPLGWQLLEWRSTSGTDFR